MNRIRSVVTLVLLWCLLSSVSGSLAETGISDLEQIFTSNVRIVESSITPTFRANKADDTHNIVFDNDQRLLAIDGQSYLYPDGIGYINHAQSGQNEMIEINVTERLPDTVDVISWIWYFNLDTKAFTRYTSLCAHKRSLDHVSLEPLWVYATDDDTERVRLCETKTGKVSVPLPSGYSWEFPPKINSDSPPPFVSPSGSWLLLFGQADGNTHVFSYRLETEILTALGVMACTGCIDWGFVDWLDTSVMIWSVDIENQHAIYSADITQENSLELAVSRPMYAPEFYDEPPRYDYVNFTKTGKYWDNFWETRCERVIYDVLSHEKVIVDLGPLCRPEQGEMDGIGYYRDITSGAEGIAALTKYDSRTRESEVLYEGEIELILWVSPDDRYAFLVMDSDGVIDTAPFLDRFSRGIPAEPTLAYVDLVEDRVIFENWTWWRWCDASIWRLGWNWFDGISETSVDKCQNVGPTGAIFPRGDNTFLVIGNKEPYSEFVPMDPTMFADLYIVQGTKVEKTRIVEGDLLPFTEEYFLSRNRDETQRTINYSLVPANGQAPIAITNPISVEEFPHIHITDIYPSENRIRFSVTPNWEIGKDWSNAFVTVQVDTHLSNE
jgi:hypothetical protein